MPSYILRETLISMAINMGFSLAFFLLVFGTLGPLPVRSMGGFAFDFVPQSFAIALMSTLVPGAIAGRLVRLGRVPRWRPPSRLPRSLWRRAALVAPLAALAGAVVGGMLLLVPGLVSIGWWPALIAKLIYGAALAGVVTPPTLRAALS